MSTENTNRTQRNSRISRKGSSKQAVCISLMFFVYVLYMEIVYRLAFSENFFGIGLVWTALFTLVAAVFFSCLICLLPSKAWQKTSFWVIVCFILVWFGFQSVYRHIFKNVCLVAMIKMGGMVLTNYYREALVGILQCAPLIALYLAPAICLIIFKKIRNKMFGADTDIKHYLRLVLVLIILIALSEAATFIPGRNIITTRDIYRRSFNANETAENFGLLTTMRLDITQMLFGTEETGTDPVQEEEPVPEEPGSTKKYNTLNLHFSTMAENEQDETIKEIDKYVAGKVPTKTNEYSGIFKGKNLIYIVAEGFWKYAVNETYTPTLYKLANEGFVFSNYYNPLGSHSTLDGEFMACTGLTPSNQFCSFYKTFGSSMYFCLGNQLRTNGYTCNAFHDHYRSYYNRDKSHPNMGYDFYAAESGLTLKMSWPESDLEMMQQVMPMMLNTEGPWHCYVLTVSGHMNYSFGGNAMAAKHKDEMEGSGYSSEASAYIACQKELDEALKYTLQALEEAGELENTVICLTADHYPYAMSPEVWEEFAGEDISRSLELAHSTLILWSGDMTEPVEVDKYCCSIDILPTLSNLFGLEYDSRLMMGRDIFSDCEGIAVFNNRSFVSEMGSYNASTNSWVPAEGVEVPENYVKNTLNYIQKIYTYSDKIVTSDYYRKIGLVH